MKKLLLGLGTVSLAILPVAAMVSCSTTETTLDTEATKFTVSLEAKTPATTTTEAVKSIMDGKDAPAKLLALETLVGKDKLPTIADGFTFEVKSAMVNSKTDTTVDVKITITETDSTETVKTKDATLSITKLTKATAPTTTLALEAAKYDISLAVLSTEAAKTSAAAAALFTGDAAAQLAVLKTLVGDNVPTTSEGFTFEVTTAVVGSVNTTVEVTITVTETAGTPGSNTATGKMTITGLTAPANK